MPPPVADPTGGLLAPVIGPLNYIVGGMEDAILTGLNVEIQMLSAGIEVSTDALNQVVTTAFGSIFNDSAIVVGQATTLLKSVLAGATDDAETIMNSAFNILDTIDGIIGSATNSAASLSQQLVDAMSSHTGSVMTTVNGIISNARSNLAGQLASRLNTITSQIINVTNSVTSGIVNLDQRIDSYVTAAINNAAREINRLVNIAVSDVKSATNKLKTIANTGTATVRGARQRVAGAIAYGDSLIVQNANALDFRDEFNSMEKRASEVLSNVNILGTITAMVVVVVVVGTVYSAYRIYNMIIRPQINKQHHCCLT